MTLQKPSSRSGGSTRRIPRIAIVIPFLVLIAWFCYMWFVSDVLPSVEKDPTTGRVKAEGYVKRVKWGEYQRQGRWVTYHENGQKASEGSYRDGAKDGEWKYWDDAGRPVTSAPVATP